MASNAELLHDVYDAFGRGDLEGWLARMDPGIEWTEPDELPYGGTYRGLEGLRELARTWARTYGEMLVSPLEFYESGDTVLVIGEYRFTTRGGEPLVADFVQVWDWRDGRAVRYRDYTDKAGKLERALAPRG